MDDNTVKNAPDRSFLDYEGLQRVVEHIKTLIVHSGGGIDSLDAPTGAIIMWSGTEEQVPTGWHICDGKDGTPDLSGKFILGSGSGEGYNVGEEGSTLAVGAEDSGMVEPIESAEDEELTDILPKYYVLAYIMKMGDGEPEEPTVHIYGVEWDLNSGDTPIHGVRTDDSADFEEPNPAVNNGTGSSPFDNLYPWCDMVKEERTGGIMVKEPKYWFKWSKEDGKLKLQIADGPVEGFHVDPVNMDRGDGVGELDFSYIGRYHCVNGWKSETNKAQKVNITRSAARDGIHSLGANFCQMDFAQMWYVGMLFLVEFADWDGQNRIGYGCSANGSNSINNGATDAMEYHTGTTAANRTTYGYIQYRNIEGWWDNVLDWMDGCYYNADGFNVILNPRDFSDNANGTTVGKLTSGGYPSDFNIPIQNGLEWALTPSKMSNSRPILSSEYWNYSPGDQPCLKHGGSYVWGIDRGPFYVYHSRADRGEDTIGCRIQERPPKQED